MKKYIPAKIELIRIDTKDIMSWSIGKDDDPWIDDPFDET